MHNLQRRVTINPATHLDTPLTEALVEQRPILTTHLEQVDDERHHHQGSGTRAPGNTRETANPGKFTEKRQIQATPDKPPEKRQGANYALLIMHCSRDRA